MRFNKQLCIFFTFYLTLFVFPSCKNEREKEKRPATGQSTTNRDGSCDEMPSDTTFNFDPANPTSKDTEALNIGRKVIELYDLYMKEITKEKNKSKDTYPLKDSAAMAYSMGYLNVSRSQYMKEKLTRAVDIDFKTLCFFVKYLYGTNPSSSAKIRASFAQYDKRELNRLGYVDCRFKEQFDDRYSLIFGLPLPTATKNDTLVIKPFVVGVQKDTSYTFFDNWNDVWP